MEKQDMALIYQGMSKDDLVREIMMLRGRLEEGGLPSIPALALEFHLAMVDYLIDYLIGDAPLLVVVLDAAGKIVRINGHFENVTGRQAAGVIGQEYQPLFVPPEGVDAFEHLMNCAREGRGSERGRWPVVDVRGRVSRVEWYNKILNGANGVFAGILSIGMDVTDRQLMEETLLLTKTSLDQLTDEIYWVTPEAVFDYVNEQACRALGFSKDELLSMRVGDVALKYDIEAWNDLWQRLKRDRHLMIETVHRRKDGRVYPVEISVNYVNIDGKEYNFAFARDITARKKIGELLHLTQQAVDSAMDEAYWILPDGSFFYVNERACESLGYSKQELSSLTLFDVAVGFEPALWDRHWNVLKKAKHIAFEGEQRRKDGSTYPVDVTISFRSVEGRDFCFAFMRDISLRKKVETELRDSELRYRTLFDISPVGISLASREGRILHCNELISRILGYSQEELLGINARELYANPDDRDDVFRILAREGMVRDFEVKLRRKGGEIIIANMNVKETFIAGSTGDLVLVIIQDVTERKRHEERLVASLREKEILLREINHRVKNNMQIIVSLLGIQSDRLKHDGAGEAFADCTRRVQTMALVHEMLYKSSDFTMINFRNYLESLIRQFAASSMIREGIGVKCNVGDVALGIDVAIPCGLIVNELLSNAVRHAFPDNASGMIFISLQKVGDDGYELVVRDNGKGIGQAAAARKDSLGLKLVEGLAGQIGAEVVVREEAGTEYRIMFRYDGPKRSG